MKYEALKNYIDKNLTIEKIANIENKSPSGIRYWLNKYGLKTSKRTFTLNEFKQIVENNFSVASSLTALNLSPTGANYRSFYKYQKENNIDISHFTGKAHLRCKTHSYNKKDLSEILMNDCSYNSHRLKKRLIKEGIKEHKCECCGLTEWLNEPVPLELEHIDGDHYNNTLENLKVLCPNCHAKTSTYRGKNVKYKKIKKLKEKVNLQKIKKTHNCSSCDIQLKKKSKTGLCKVCYHKTQRKVERPPINKLLQEVKETSYLAVGKKYGVSDNCIRKWINSSTD